MTKPNQGGSGDSPTQTPTPDGTANPTEGDVAFGLDGDPSNPPAEGATGDPKPPEGNPEAGPTPAKGSEEGEGFEPTRKFANKYESPEALEAGYNNLFAHQKDTQAKLEQVQNELAQLRGQQANPALVPQGQQPAAAPSTPTAADQKGFMNDPAIKAGLDHFKEYYGEDDAKVIEGMFEAMGRHTATGKPSDASDEIAQLRAEREAEKAQQALLKKYPAAANYEENISDREREILEKSSDLGWLKELVWKSVQADNMEAIIDKEANRRAEKLLEQKIAEGVANNLVVATNIPGQVATVAASPGEDAFGLNDPDVRAKHKIG